MGNPQPAARPFPSESPDVPDCSEQVLNVPWQRKHDCNAANNMGKNLVYSFILGTTMEHLYPISGCSTENGRFPQRKYGSSTAQAPWFYDPAEGF